MAPIGPRLRTATKTNLMKVRVAKQYNLFTLIVLPDVLVPDHPVLPGTGKHGQSSSGPCRGICSTPDRQSPQRLDMVFVIQISLSRLLEIYFV